MNMQSLDRWMSRKGCRKGRKASSLICEPENRRRDQARAHAIFYEFLLALGVFTLTCSNEAQIVQRTTENEPETEKRHRCGDPGCTHTPPELLRRHRRHLG